MKRPSNFIIVLLLIILSASFFCIQLQDVFAFLFVSPDDDNVEGECLVVQRRSGTRYHFILTVQCMLLILLPMYINMFFSLFASQDSDQSCNLETTLKCGFSPETKNLIKNCLENTNKLSPNDKEEVSV